MDLYKNLYASKTYRYDYLLNTLTSHDDEPPWKENIQSK